MSNPLESGDLRRWTFEGVAADAFHEFAAGPLKCAYGFTYTTAAARFCKPHNGTLVEHDGEKVQFNHVFEVRLFGPLADLHWVREGDKARANRRADRGALHWVREGDKGRLVVTSEVKDTEEAEKSAVIQAMAPDNLKAFKPSEPIEDNRPARWRDHTYLLWGEKAGIEKGWTKLVTARIGTLWAPFELAGGNRAVLVAREYFVTSTDGNAVYAGERLMGLRAAHKDDSKFERS